MDAGQVGRAIPTSGWAFLAILAAATLLAIPVGNAEAAFPGKNGKIAFNRGGSGIYTVNANGGGLRRLRKDGYEPAWSANGRKIAFVREDRKGRGEIWKMNAQGGGLRRLTNSKAYDQQPAWSANGKKIVFTRQPNSGDSEIFKMKANGSRERRLTGNNRDDYHPAWSPKGNRIAYARARSGGYADIFIMDGRSGQSRALTKTSRRTEFNPTWSPNGKQVAFGAAYQGAAFFSGMFKMRASGGGEYLLTDPVFGGDEPAWSPNGRKIVYRLFSTTGWLGLGAMRANGSALPWGFQGSSADRNPDWQPR